MYPFITQGFLSPPEATRAKTSLNVYTVYGVCLCNKVLSAELQGNCQAVNTQPSPHSHMWMCPPSPLKTFFFFLLNFSIFLPFYILVV